MSFFNLKLIHKSDDKIILTVPLYTRIIMGLFTIAVAYTFVLDPGFSLLPAFFLFVLLATTLYKESWVFDKKERKVIYGFGLLILYKKTVVPFHSIEEFKLEGFVKGSMSARPNKGEENPLSKKPKLRSEFWKLSLNNSIYGELTINTVKGKQKEILLENSRQIASLCGVKLIEE
ncbi:hypothetical protein [Spirochaeta isovalerica]|uniref:DUF304 domain-containing protein n=1 Tax=Spirochaeta isovalerica TaxID=150 RepID=A0A841RE62_9SPIO|nr:hypothetical protein [Spirochaeta isovalerica]MBB6481129.1 hypothetical protein [Spirochaeta isovalerica]